jgi:hypothetical protein
MFTTLLRWFGSRQERPARVAGRQSFTLRLESLEGRATPGGVVSPAHVGEEIPQTGNNSAVAVYSDPGIEVDPTGGKPIGSDFGVGIDPSSIKPSSSGEFLYGIQVDPTGGGMVGSDFGVGVDLNGGHSTSGDFLYGVQVNPTAAPTVPGGETGVGSVDLNGCRGGLGGEV